MKYFVVFLLTTSAAFAQEFRSTIAGRVTDPSGSAVVSVKVVAAETQTGAKYEATTGQGGEYTLTFIPPGPYTITAEVKGFRKHVQEGVTVSTNQRLTIDISLQLGSQTESITVSADVQMLQTASASVGQVIGESQIAVMPMNGRTPLSLAQLSFGVTPSSDPRFTRPFDNAGPAGFSMGGGQSQANELLLDGSPDMTRNRRVAYNPPVDAVQEIKVEAFQPDAAYGNTGGGTVNVVMKGGTNNFHGSLYEFHQNQQLKATPFFTNAASQKKPVTRFNQYGLTVGGPIWIPKKGVTINLTVANLPIYKRIIDVYEENDLKVNGDLIYINGSVATSYTFKMDYFWMMGDNRYNSADSRYWGFVPEDHVVGKASFVWLSLDKNKSFLSKIRFDRFFMSVK